MSTNKTTRQLIVGAAAELLKTKSFDDLTVRDICNKCGISRQLFYYYFKDKFDLVNSTYKHDVDDIIAQYTLDTSWRQIAFHVLYYMKANQEFYSKAFACTGQNSFYEFFNEYSYELIRKVMEHHSDDDVADLSTLASLRFYSNACVFSTQQWALGNMSLEPDSLAGIIDDNIPNAIRGFFG